MKGTVTSVALVGALVAPACHRQRIEVRPPEIRSGLGTPITVTELAVGVAPASEGQILRRHYATFGTTARDTFTTKGLQRGTRLRFELFEDLEIIAVVQYVEPYHDTGVAVIASGESHAAHVTLTYAAGQLGALMTLPNEGDVEIRALASNRLLVSQRARRLSLTCGASAQRVLVGPKVAAGRDALAADATSQIDVGVLYTPAVSIDEVTLRQMLDTWAFDSSSYFSCSGINARINVVSVMKLDYKESGVLKKDLKALHQPGTTAGDAVLKFREDGRVDVVLVLVGKGNELGRANVFATATGDQFKNIATGVAVGTSAVAWVLLHELGHTMGGGHQSGHGKGRYLYSHGNVIESEYQDAYTVMAAGRGMRLPLFSGPDVPLGSGSTGSKTRDNVRTLNQTRSMVELFQSSSRSPQPAVPCNNMLYVTKP